MGDDGDGTLHMIDGGVSLSVGDLSDDDSTYVLLGNYATVVLAGDDLGDMTIWRRPKHW
jgi:hypothetical protein